MDKKHIGKLVLGALGTLLVYLASQPQFAAWSQVLVGLGGALIGGGAIKRPGDVS